MMKISVLDRFSLGNDTPFSVLSSLGELTLYDKTDGEELIERCNNSDAVIINKIKMTRDVLSKCKGLKLICVFATGYDNIDLEAAREFNIAVCNVPAYSTESVALFTVTTVLALAMHIKEYASYVERGEYTASGIPNRLVPVYHELKGKTWGIVGLGNIGKRVAEIATVLGANVVAFKRTPSADYPLVDIDTLCKTSDIITVHCPLNDGTRSLINSKRLALMKKDVILVNEARGAVLDEAAVADAIKKGMLGAFGSDVYSEEPFTTEHPYYEIMNRNNVLLTPHAAWGSYESRARCVDIICQNIKSFTQGKTLNRVDILRQN